jgi:AmiR/NasT family two-component response regulator
LKLRQNLLGAMSLHTLTERSLSADDVALGQALADVASIGLAQRQVRSEPTALAEELQSALNGRILVEQAKGILAEHSGRHPTDMFPLLRAHARRTGLALQRVAGDLVDGALTTSELMPAAAPLEDSR